MHTTKGAMNTSLACCSRCVTSHLLVILSSLSAGCDAAAPALHTLLSCGVEFAHLHSLWLYSPFADKHYRGYLVEDVHRLRQLERLTVANYMLTDVDRRILVILPQIRDMNMTNTLGVVDDKDWRAYRRAATYGRSCWVSTQHSTLPRA